MSDSDGRSPVRMLLVTVIAAACLLLDPAQAGIKDLGSHFDGTPEPRGSSPGGAAGMEEIPLDFHKQNTVTNDLIFDGFEDEDYIDFDKILAEGSDDYK